MPVHLKVYKQDNIKPIVYSEVDRVGHILHSYCNRPEVVSRINDANSPGQSSSKVQAVILEKAIELGFQSEKKHLFKSIPTANLRPDYYKPIHNTGIIIEVERGKTIMNNMDMLDMWKCHLCESANHLFLFVPNVLKHNDSLKGYDCFRIVSNRLSPFFDKTNYCNVHSLWLFGY